MNRRYELLSVAVGALLATGCYVGKETPSHHGHGTGHAGAHGGGGSHGGTHGPAPGHGGAGTHGPAAGHGGGGTHGPAAGHSGGVMQGMCAHRIDCKGMGGGGHLDDSAPCSCDTGTACCDMHCKGMACNTVCHAGTSCAVKGTHGGTFDAHCKGASCLLDARGAGVATIACDHGADCVIRCAGATECMTTCKGAMTKCELHCGHAAEGCMLATCGHGMPKHCPGGGMWVCGKPCPGGGGGMSGSGGHI